MGFADRHASLAVISVPIEGGGARLLRFSVLKS
jgi:hypothetical protein